jgi:hypothetical protein
LRSRLSHTSPGEAAGSLLRAVTLEDQFATDPVPVMVGEPVMICPPTAKTVGEETFSIEDEQEHYVLYTAPAEAEPGNVFVTNQFGEDVSWRLPTPKYLMVPTAKTVGEETFDDRDNMNHYWCYEANGPRVGVRATLDDQFNGPDKVPVTTPTLFCNPAEKVHGDDTFPIEDEELHLACYEIHGKQKTQQFTVGLIGAGPGSSSDLRATRRPAARPQAAVRSRSALAPTRTAPAPACSRIRASCGCARDGTRRCGH